MLIVVSGVERLRFNDEFDEGSENENTGMHVLHEYVVELSLV